MTTITEEELKSFISIDSLDAYRAASKAERSEIREWVATLQRMSDEEFVAECASKIYESAFTGQREAREGRSFRGSAWGVHARAHICADEGARRHRLAGHDADCCGANLYHDGYNTACRSHNLRMMPSIPCTCGFKKRETS